MEHRSEGVPGTLFRWGTPKHVVIPVPGSRFRAGCRFLLVPLTIHLDTGEWIK